MIKWILLVCVLAILTILTVTFIKLMLRAEKDSKKNTTNEVDSSKEYIPEEQHIDIHSASDGVSINNMSDKKDEADFVNSVLNESSNGFIDDVDEDFTDFSSYARSGKSPRPPIDFDLDGDMADEYIPSSPDFNYLPKRTSTKKQPISKALNELPTELKVLMLSDIFDRKFFD